MKDIFTVMNFTIKEMVKRKSFIISTLIILLLIVIGFNIPNIIEHFNGSDTREKLLLVDLQNIFEGKLELLQEDCSDYDLEFGQYSYEEIKEKIENEEIDSAILIEEVDNNINIKYIVENAMYIDGVPEDLTNTISGLYSNMQISKLGLTEEQISMITPHFEFSIEQTEEDEAEGNILVMMLMSIVLFYAIYFGAYQVSSSITTEKTSKIMETLVTSTTPKIIVLGKTIGIGLVGLLQLILIVGTAYISAKTFLDPELLNSVLDMSNITIYLALITMVYFILGYFVYSLMYALTGSTVSKPEDIQSANTPVAILALVGFYLSYFTMMNPTSNLNIFASLCPISSPFCMPFRIMMGLASIKDVLISIALLIITILVVAQVSIKIYSNAILNYGTKMSFKDIVKMYKDKQN